MSNFAIRQCAVERMATVWSSVSKRSSERFRRSSENMPATDARLSGGRLLQQTTMGQARTRRAVLATSMRLRKTLRHITGYGRQMTYLARLERRRLVRTRPRAGRVVLCSLPGLPQNRSRTSACSGARAPRVRP